MKRLSLVEGHDVDGSWQELVKNENGSLVRFEEAQAEIEKLKNALVDERDANASHQFAYADMKKYAYRVGHKDECFTLGRELKSAREEIEKLRAALKFYADCEHYDEVERNGEAYYPCLDFGTVARKALGE